ncbi:TPA: hypothetical protein ACF3D0_002671, partial [Enterococcus faecium]
TIFFYYSTLFDSRFKTLQQNPLKYYEYSKQQRENRSEHMGDLLKKRIDAIIRNLPKNGRRISKII